MIVTQDINSNSIVLFVFVTSLTFWQVHAVRISSVYFAFRKCRNKKRRKPTTKHLVHTIAQQGTFLSWMMSIRMTKGNDTQIPNTWVSTQTTRQLEWQEKLFRVKQTASTVTTSKTPLDYPRTNRKKTSNLCLLWRRQSQTIFLPVMRDSTIDRREASGLVWARVPTGLVDKKDMRTFFKRLMQIQIFRPLIYSTIRLTSNGQPRTSHNCSAKTQYKDRTRE